MSNKGIQIKRFLPPTLVALGIAAVGVWQGGVSSPQASVSQKSSISSTEKAAPITEAPHVSVNGKPVKVGSDGKADLALPGGSNAHVEVSGDRASVTTSNPSDDFSSTLNPDSDLDVTVHTDSTGGRNNGTTHVFNSTNVHGSSRGSTSTHVFSSDSAQIDVKAP